MTHEFKATSFAIGDDGITLGIAPDSGNHIIHAHSETRARSGYYGNRAGHAAADFYADRPILVRHTLGCKIDSARRRIAATALGQPERWGCNIQTAAPRDAVRVIG